MGMADPNDRHRFERIRNAQTQGQAAGWTSQRGREISDSIGKMSRDRAMANASAGIQQSGRQLGNSVSQMRGAQLLAFLAAIATVVLFVLFVSKGNTFDWFFGEAILPVPEGF